VVCGGPEGSVLNRPLGVVLDDRCRQLVDVIKHGGRLTERKELWERAIVHIHTPTAQSIAKKLGVQPHGPSNPEHVTSCSPKLAGEPCAVCMEPMKQGARVQTLECCSQHTFHHECIASWLAESTTCPLCREDLSGGQCGLSGGQCGANAGQNRGDQCQAVPLNPSSMCSVPELADFDLMAMRPDSELLDSSWLDLVHPSQRALPPPSLPPPCASCIDSVVEPGGGAGTQFNPDLIDPTALSLDVSNCDIYS
jgi:hypothetical protein